MNGRTTACLLTAILLAGAGLRLVGITHPIVGHHSWRQADTAAVARNFVEERFNILYPRIDWRGTECGEVECEFPVYQFVLASLYKVFGVHEALGRLLTLLFSLSAIVGVYLLSRHVASRTVGLWAAFFMAILPMPTYFGRALMPESLLLAACIYGVFFFLRWTESGQRRLLALSAASLITACLLKPPTLYLGLPLAYLAVRKYKARALLKPELWVYAGLIFAAIVLWYVHAYGIKQDTQLTFGVWEYGSDKWGNWALLRSSIFWQKVFIERIPDDFLAFFGIPLLIIGLVIRPGSDRERLFLLWLAGLLVLALVVAKGVLVHDYYLLPAVVPMAYFMGKGADWGFRAPLRARYGAKVGVGICVLGVVVLSLSRYGYWLSKERPSRSADLQLARAADSALPRDALIVTAGNGDPVVLYYARRKGWRVEPAELTARWVHNHAAQGAAYVLGTHEDFEEAGATAHRDRLLAQHVVVTNSPKFFIVSLEKGPGRTE